MQTIPTIHLLDDDPVAARRAESTLYRLLRNKGIAAQVFSVSCPLELTRSGVINTLPVVRINGCVVSTQTPFSTELLASIVERMDKLLQQDAA